ncbi:MAG TPA: hypothetical protein VHZ98_00440 [Galbitalea sp.]|jgi:hypothetical protein|nr:hypothetical protein [Galbitalea sp.]
MSVSDVPDLPAWTPPQVPTLQPPRSTAKWAGRIGIPAAVRLGQMRARIVGAAVCVLFVPVGAVRILIGSHQSATATDPWGPGDAFVIFAAFLGVLGIVLFAQAARRQRANAVHSGFVILRQANTGVTEGQIAPLLSSTARFDEWAAGTSLVPLAENPKGLAASEEGARLMFARKARGGYRDRVERFGPTVAGRFRVSLVAAWIGTILVDGSALAAAAGVITAFMLLKLGHPNAFADLGPAIIALTAGLAVGLAILLGARYGPRGRYAIADRLRAALVGRDPSLTRQMTVALIARPYLYDLWIVKYGSNQITSTD